MVPRPWSRRLFLAAAGAAFPARVGAADSYTLRMSLAGSGSTAWNASANHIALTNHVFSFLPLIGSRAKIASLPPDLQKILKDEAAAIGPSWRAATVGRTAEAAQSLRARGMTFTETDYAGFRKAMDPVYASLQGKLGADLIQSVNRTANAQ